MRSFDVLVERLMKSSLITQFRALIAANGKASLEREEPLRQAPRLFPGGGGER